jgi:hypothetical protein
VGRRAPKLRHLGRRVAPPRAGGASLLGRHRAESDADRERAAAAVQAAAAEGRVSVNELDQRLRLLYEFCESWAPW